MAGISDEIDLRRRLEREVTRELGYDVERPLFFTPLLSAIAAACFLYLIEFLSVFEGAGFRGFEDWPIHYMVAILLAGAAGYVYEHRRRKVWFDLLDRKLMETSSEAKH